MLPLYHLPSDTKTIQHSHNDREIAVLEVPYHGSKSSILHKMHPGLGREMDENLSSIFAGIRILLAAGLTNFELSFQTLVFRIE